MILENVDVVNDISKEDFQKNYFKKQKPLLIKNFASRWDAFDLWNLAYIREKAGDQDVPLYDNKPADAAKSSDAPVAHMKMKDYIDTIKSKPSDLRIFFYIITDRLPELLKNFTYPDLGIKFFKRLPTLFFGGSEAHVLMHYDVDLGDFMHIHFEGKKRILLFDQKQSPFLYKVPLSVHTIYDVDYENPDYEKFPALKYAKGYEIFMEHGDALFIPGAFWHFNRRRESRPKRGGRPARAATAARTWPCTAFCARCRSGRSSPATRRRSIASRSRPNAGWSSRESCTSRSTTPF
ncbi:cupin-like domain-containing protein [Chryseobacterium sp.]|uniref:cupin-like domain-containing protein n=1 Tax=Chryseobacterium sp. TaxID=1871047 RepID=UPI00321B5348